MNFLDQIVNYIIRPTRDYYHINRLGNRNIQVKSAITNKNNKAERIDTQIRNYRNQKIKLSYYQNSTHSETCVIYLHANNGSRVEGLPFIKPLLQQDFNVCLFDFSGSGQSQGQYITLGLKQSYDLECVVKFLKKQGIKNIILWGRSMGAVTAIIYSERQSNYVQGLILDSPFKQLKKLIKQLASDRTGLPRFIFQPVLSFVQSNVKQKTGENISNLQMKTYLKNPVFYNIPALFLVSKQDKLVKMHHGQKLHSRYLHPNKQIQYIEIEHHEARQHDIINKCIRFIFKTLKYVQDKQLMQLKQFQLNKLPKRCSTANSLQKEENIKIGYNSNNIKSPEHINPLFKKKFSCKQSNHNKNNYHQLNYTLNNSSSKQTPYIALLSDRKKQENMGENNFKNRQISRNFSNNIPHYQQKKVSLTNLYTKTMQNNKNYQNYEQNTRWVETYYPNEKNAKISLTHTKPIHPKYQ